MVTTTNLLSGSSAETALVNSGADLMGLSLNFIYTLFDTFLTILSNNIGYVVAFVIFAILLRIAFSYIRRGV